LTYAIKKATISFVAYVSNYKKFKGKVVARPIKWRNVCSLPKSSKFGPLDCKREDEIIMSVDEYEAIRLIDLEGFNQEECAKQMNIARSTVQGIYISARKKLAESLVNGKTLFIKGGEYKLCDGLGGGCGKGCRKKKFKQERMKMKIAIPVDEKNIDAKVASSFGRATYFLIYDVTSKSESFVENEALQSKGGAGIKAAQTIVDSGAGILLTPRLGENAADVVQGAEIKIYKTTDGSAKENINAFIDGKLDILDEFHEGKH